MKHEVAFSTSVPCLCVSVTCLYVTKLACCLKTNLFYIGFSVYSTLYVFCDILNILNEKNTIIEDFNID